MSLCNIKLLILPLLALSVSGAGLRNNYLPPGNARTAGGSGSFLGAPFQGSGFGGGSFSGSRTAEGGAHIVRFNNVNNGDGSYQFDYQTDNKISVNEAGRLKNADTEEVHGSYSYTSPEGQVITVNYVADENGFHPTGDHLPTPPPIPEAILKSLQQNAAGGGSYDDGSYNGGSSGFGGNSGYRY